MASKQRNCGCICGWGSASDGDEQHPAPSRTARPRVRLQRRVVIGPAPPPTAPTRCLPHAAGPGLAAGGAGGPAAHGQRAAVVVGGQRHVAGHLADPRSAVPARRAATGKPRGHRLAAQRWAHRLAALEQPQPVRRSDRPAPGLAAGALAAAQAGAGRRTGHTRADHAAGRPAKCRAPHTPHPAGAALAHRRGVSRGPVAVGRRAGGGSPGPGGRLPL